MNQLISSLLDNDSTFGRIMTRCGTVIALSILFAISMLPVITIGAGWTGVSRAFLKMYRTEDHVINPFKEFWKGFKGEFKQSTLVWLVAAVLAALLALEWFWCTQFGGFFLTFRYCFVAIGVIEAILVIYIFPDIAAFNGSIKDHFKNSIFFAFSNPVNLGIIIVTFAVPIALTYIFTDYLPLFGFLWIFCGYALLIQVCCKLLVKQYAPHLDPVEESSESAPEQSEKDVLEDMKKLGM